MVTDAICCHSFFLAKSFGRDNPRHRKAAVRAVPKAVFNSIVIGDGIFFADHHKPVNRHDVSRNRVAKGSLVDLTDGRRHNNGFQRITLKECHLADGCHAVGDRHPRQRTTLTKGGVSDRGNAVGEVARSIDNI